MTPRSLRVLALGVVLSGLVACTGGSDDTGPTSTTRPTPSTTVVDRSGIALARVPGETTTTIQETGTARITGSVSGPSGPVPGATVRLERLVAGREVRTDVVTGEDGRFLLEGVPGGRYRVRAFLAPSLAQTEPEVRFLADGEEHTFDLTVESHGGVAVLADAAPDQPLLDAPVNVVVRVLNRTVDADGIVRSVGVPDLIVELTGLGRWNLRRDADATSTTSTTSGVVSTTSSTTAAPPTRATARTDRGGQARFELRCDSPGSPGLVLQVPVRRPTPGGPADPAAPSTTAAAALTTEAFPLDLPDCVDPATTTTLAPTTTESTTTSPPG
jgi:hypothetical protein